MHQMLRVPFAYSFPLAADSRSLESDELQSPDTRNSPIDHVHVDRARPECNNDQVCWFSSRQMIERMPICFIRSTQLITSGFACSGSGLRPLNWGWSRSGLCEQANLYILSDFSPKFLIFYLTLPSVFW